MCPATASGAAQDERCFLAQNAAVDPEFDLRVQALARRASKSPSREAAKNALTTRRSGAPGQGPAPASSARAGARGWRVAARRLRSGRARRCRRTPTPNTSWRTNASRSAGRQRIEHHEQREPDGVGEQRRLLGVDAAGEADYGVGHVNVRDLRPRAPGAQHVQAHPSDDRREPGLHVLDALGILVADPNPGFLQGVVGLGERPEHPVGDGAQARPVLVETVGQPLALIMSAHRLRRGLEITSGCGQPGLSSGRPTARTRKLTAPPTRRSRARACAATAQTK